MNCDQAFDCLTDPQRRETPELLRHLSGCRRCRALQDALEPALDLFDELVSEPDVSVRNPGGRAAMTSDTLQLAEQTAARLAGSEHRPPGRVWRHSLRYAAALLAGVAVALALQSPVNDASGELPGVRECLGSQWVADPDVERTSQEVEAQCSVCHRRQEPAGIDPAASFWGGNGWLQLTAQRPRPDLGRLLLDGPFALVAAAGELPGPAAFELVYFTPRETPTDATT